MKKIAVLAILISSLGIAGELTIRGGFTGTSFDQNDNTSPINQNTKVKSGAFIGVDYVTELPMVTKNLKFGIGADFGGVNGNDEDFSKKYLNSGVNTYDYKYDDSVILTIPVYGIIKYEFANDTKITPYLSARIGYDLASTKNDVKNYKTGETNDLKIDNGFYYGFGAGIKLTKWSFELNYSVTETKLSYEDDYYKIDNSKKNLEKLGISAGYTFEF